jgi:hypothetical protein
MTEDKHDIESKEELSQINLRLALWRGQDKGDLLENVFCLETTEQEFKELLEIFGNKPVNPTLRGQDWYKKVEEVEIGSDMPVDEIQLKNYSSMAYHQNKMVGASEVVVIKEHRKMGDKYSVYILRDNTIPLLMKY